MDEFKIHAVGGTPEEMWVVAGDALLYYEDDEAHIFSKILNKALQRSEGERPHLGLFVYTPGKGWRTEALSKLPQFESAVNSQCEISIEDHKLYMNGNEVASGLLIGLVRRAGWLQGGSMFYAMSDWHVQVGAVADCRVSGWLQAWTLDGISASSRSVVFEIPGGFEVLTPSYTGIEAFRILK